MDMLTPYKESKSFFLSGLECSIPAKSKYKHLLKLTNPCTR